MIGARRSAHTYEAYVRVRVCYACVPRGALFIQFVVSAPVCRACLARRLACVLRRLAKASCYGVVPCAGSCHSFNSLEHSIMCGQAVPCLNTRGAIWLLGLRVDVVHAQAAAFMVQSMLAPVNSFNKDLACSARGSTTNIDQIRLALLMQFEPTKRRCTELNCQRRTGTKMKKQALNLLNFYKISYNFYFIS